MSSRRKIMNWMRALVIGAAFAVCVGTAASRHAASQDAPETYSYRYRMTISIEVDGQAHTGSSVIEVIWKRRPDFGNGAGYLSSVRGQAVFIDIGSHGAIVAALHGGTPTPDLRNGPWAAQWIAPRAFHMSVTPELPDLRMEGRRELALDNLPPFLWFSNPADPATARAVTPAEFPTLLGSGAHLVAADVEITDDPIVIDMDRKLPWYSALRNRPNNGAIYLPSGLGLWWTMFVGANT